MEISLVDACGGVFGNQGGVIKVFEVDTDRWNEVIEEELCPEEVKQNIRKLEEEGVATCIDERRVDEMFVL